MGGVFTKTIPVSNGTIGCYRLDMRRNMMSPMLCSNTKPLAIQDATYFGMPQLIEVDGITWHTLLLNTGLLSLLKCSDLRHFCPCAGA
jgi:hypothetical protein